MSIQEIFKRYIEDMENNDYLMEPYTTRRFIELYNFNNPSVEEAWSSAYDEVRDRAKSYVEKELLSSNLQSIKISDDDPKIKVCYL